MVRQTVFFRQTKQFIQYFYYFNQQLWSKQYFPARCCLVIELILQLKQQEQAILKAINSIRVKFCLKQYCFHIFVQVQASDKTVFNFLILGKSRFPAKKFYKINCDSMHNFSSFFNLILALTRFFPEWKIIFSSS